MHNYLLVFKVTPLFSLLFSFLICLPTFAQAKAIELNRIAAIVNNSVITQTELNNRIELITQQILQQGTAPPTPAILKAQVLEQLIIETLQMSLANSTGIKIDDETLNRTIKRIATNNKLSLTEFHNVLENDGFKFSDFRENIRQEITIRRLHERQIHRAVVVSQQDIEQFLSSQPANVNRDKSFHLAHILIALPEASSPEQIASARNKIDSITTQLDEGSDFAALAISYSDGQQALRGGDLGWKKFAELPTLFANVIPDLGINEVSKVIRGPNGFHLVKLMGVKGEKRHNVNKTHARHILIKIDKKLSDTDAKAALIKLRKRIIEGESFAKIAEAHSDDMGSAINGGDLNWLAPGETVAQFETAMNSLSLDEISQPVRSAFGWHLIQVLERKQFDDTVAFERNQAQQIIRQRKIEEDTETWLRRLRDEAYVEYRNVTQSDNT
ncbi:Periplasmic chaperone and peptidyl-prolyl cis-trans isomerase of outer membrane proteins SurA [hydrothermal vent metagenome]|uniref:Periplasmic chaperone and peptidyl-prolyl cis-trans isomerase of outer membrane proteins SurA n=1 Tax=hydrothermal vent metagenome TaxID=652676 RepID=A0A3B0ZY20_9ZZZZ